MFCEKGSHRVIITLKYKVSATSVAVWLVVLVAVVAIMVII